MVDRRGLMVWQTGLRTKEFLKGQQRREAERRGIGSVVLSEIRSLTVARRKFGHLRSVIIRFGQWRSSTETV